MPVVPGAGVRIRSEDVARLLNAQYTRAMMAGRVAANALFTDTYGLMKYADGTWRVFPLESRDTFVVRDCQGRFLARAYRA